MLPVLLVLFLLSGCAHNAKLPATNTELPTAPAEEARQQQNSDAEKAEPSEPSESADVTSDWQSADLQNVSELYRLSLSLPPEWRAEYVPAIESINVYDPQAAGASNLEKSRLFIRYFDASSFLTLQTVTIHNRTLRTLAEREAVEYDIEKKSGVADFPSQPAWRNGRHTVTDIRENSGFSRFYVIGQNPAVDKATVELILQSIKFLP